MDAIYSPDDALEVVAAFLDEQRRTGRQGERQIAVNFDRHGRITSIKLCPDPPRFKRAEHPRKVKES